MGTKTISLSDEAYSRLKSRKKKGESFSDVVNRLTERRRLSELAGILEDEDGEILEETIASLRMRSKQRLENIRKEFSE